MNRVSLFFPYAKNVPAVDSSHQKHILHAI